MEHMYKNSMRKYSMAVIYDYPQMWKEMENFSDYIITNYKCIYKKSTDEYFSYTNIITNITLTNNNGYKKQKPLIRIIKQTFHIQYDYIYLDEYFYTIPTLTTYGISNYNRVINYKNGFIMKPIVDNNTIYVSILWYDNGQKCHYPSLEQLWTKVHGTSDLIDVNNEMDYTCEKEIYRYIPGFSYRYRVSNYGNIKNDTNNIYITPQLVGGYSGVQLYYNKKPYPRLVHQLVILGFKGYPPTNKHTVEP